MTSLRLPPDLEEKLARISIAEKKTKTDIIKESLRLYIQSRGTDVSPYGLASKYFGHSASPGKKQDAGDHRQIVRNKIKQKYNV